jgi:hypothetical protein
MSAFTELAIFCGDHPEIRAHKRIGELLQATAAELAQLKFDKDELTKSILALRGEMGDTKALDGLFELWESCGEIPMTPVNLRAMEKAAAELAELKKTLQNWIDSNLHCVDMNNKLENENAQLRTENEEAKKLLDELERAECNYRADHDVRGDGSLETGRAWDHMRHCGERASTFLKAHPERK